MGYDIKKHIFLSLAVILFISYNSLADVRDSTAKYEGTKYIGDIFKVYDYVPEPINKRVSLRMLNSFHVVPMSSGLIYETGFTYHYNIPMWNEGLFWVRSTIGAYFKVSAQTNTIYTIGLATQIRFDSPFYIGLNGGFFWGTWDEKKYDNETDKYVIGTLDGGGFEEELIFGYDFNINDWLITPEIKFNFNISPNYNYYSDNALIKSPIQFGLNIGRDF